MPITGGGGGGGGASTYLALTDTPGGYGSAGQRVVVNGSGTGLDFITATDTTTASSLGGGSAVLAGVVGDDLQFKSIVAGTNITVSSDANTITINAPAAAATTFIGLTDTVGALGTDGQLAVIAGGVVDFRDADTYSSLGGTSLIGTKTVNDFQFKGLTAGTGVTLDNTTDPNVIAISASAGTSLTVQEEGANVDTAVTTINFIGTDITAAPNGAGSVNVTVASDTASTLGAGTAVLSGKVVNDFQFKSLIGGTNVTLDNTTDPNEIVINVAAGAGDNLGNHEMTQAITVSAGNTHDIATGAAPIRDIYATAYKNPTGQGLFMTSTVDAEIRVGAANFITLNKNGTPKVTVGDEIQFTPSSGNPTIGDVWTASAADGTGEWATPSGGWALTGNAGTDGGTTNFMGTTDNVDLAFRRNSAEGFRLNASNQIQTKFGIVPEIAVTNTVGTSSLPFFSNYANTYQVQNGATGNTVLQISRAAGNPRIYADSAQGTALNIETSNNGAGASSDMNLTIGTATTTQGEFKFLKSGVANLIGDVWTATTTDGEGYWATPSGGADNLGNHTATQDINLDGNFLIDSSVASGGSVRIRSAGETNYAQITSELDLGNAFVGFAMSDDGGANSEVLIEGSFAVTNGVDGGLLALQGGMCEISAGTSTGGNLSLSGGGDDGSTGGTVNGGNLILSGGASFGGGSSGIIQTQSPVENISSAIAALDVDFSLGDVHTKSITANTTLTFSATPTTGSRSTIIAITADGTNRDVTFPAGVAVAGGNGSAVTVTVLASTTTIFTLLWIGSQAYMTAVEELA